MWKACSSILFAALLGLAPGDPPATPPLVDEELPADVDEFLGMLEMLEEYGAAVEAEAELVKDEAPAKNETPTPGESTLDKAGPEEPEPSGK